MKMYSNTTEKINYVFVLDFEIAKVYRYQVGTKNLGENWDTEKIEEYLTDLGHNLGNIEWMLTRNKKINKGIYNCRG